MPGDLRLALENVRALATRAKVYGWRPEDADHLLRFCAGAGVESSPLRAPSSPEPETGTTIVWAETQPDSYRGLCTSCGDTFGGIRAGGKPVIERAHREFCQPPAAPAPRPPARCAYLTALGYQCEKPEGHSGAHFAEARGAPAPRPEETREDAHG